MQVRIKIYAIFLVIIFGATVSRLFFWQILKGKELSYQARLQHQSGRKLQAPRGSILSSEGSWLVSGRQMWQVYAYKPHIDIDLDEVADKVSKIFVDQDFKDPSKSEYLEEANRLKRLLNGGANWMVLKSGLDKGQKDEVMDLNIEGVEAENYEMRDYPEASTAAHLLGFVGKDKDGNDTGYFGLEGYYDLILSGKPGYLSRESDAYGAPILMGELRESRSIEGFDLVTNIDKGVQHMLDIELEKGVRSYGAKSATAVIMNPNNGAVLAMSSYPKYSPERYYNFSDDQFRNPAIAENFEPGSVFKVLVMAAALDAGAVEPDTRCDICDGPYQIGKYSIKTWDGKYYEDTTMTDVIVHSDNVGMVFAGKRLGKSKMYKYLEKFGIGQSTGIDLQGESYTNLREKGSWGEIDLATASFGQGIATTPIQLITAVSAIANDGVMYTPQVVDKIAADGWIEDIEPEEKYRVIDKKAADQITAMMVEAAKKGEAKWTHLKGFKVAGKTGTAQIPIAGHYDDEKTIVSFVGFVPADDPEFAMIVTLREPESSPWASETAAPLWYSIAKDLFLHFGIQPEN